MLFMHNAKKDFNDLIVEEVLSKPNPEAEEYLRKTFPGKDDIRVFTDRGGNTVINVDDVQIRISSF